MCWLDLATAYPDIWFSIILGVSVRVLPDEINFGISRLRKADGPCLVWVGLQSFETWIEQKTEEGRICSLSLTVFELGHWFSPTFGLSLELTSSVLLILRPLDLDWNCTIVSSGLPACKGCTLGLFNFPNLHEPIPYDKPLLSFMCVCVCVCVLIYIHIHVCTTGSVSLEKWDSYSYWFFIFWNYEIFWQYKKISQTCDIVH